MSGQADSPDLSEAVSGVAMHGRRFASPRVILALMLREMSTSYGRSPGGYLWAIIEPVGVILVLAFGFSLLVRHPSLGRSFILFYASGYLVFSLYRSVEQVVTQSIRFSRPLLRYPAVSWIDAVFARFLLSFLTHVLIMFLILGGLYLVLGEYAVIDMRPIALAVLLAGFLGLGVGTLNCLLMGKFPVWQSAYHIVTRPLMLASAVLYVLEDLSGDAATILWWNPLVHLTGLMRAGLYSTYHPQYISITYVAGLALGTFTVGLLFLHAYHSDLINKE
ncbi:MAG: ABC transporter permease [Maritimibacter sp.]